MVEIARVGHRTKISNFQQTTVGAECLTSDVTRFIGCEQDHGIRDIAGELDPAQRNSRNSLVSAVPAGWPESAVILSS
ncbi:hypothetical protein CM1200mP19_1600 [bacterium]|nr:MAG: hypothetical protein CM1200mP19_1600 [bacterium]